MLGLERYDWERQVRLRILPWYRKVLRWEWWWL